VQYLKITIHNIYLQIVKNLKPKQIDKMSKQGSSFKDALQNVFATSAILIAFIIAYILYSQIR
jgi:hypothetical protein